MYNQITILTISHNKNDMYKIEKIVVKSDDFNGKQQSLHNINNKMRRRKSCVRLLPTT